MKYCILTPTFRGHFKYLRNYLSSFSKKLEDKDNCVFYFIVNDNETREIERILINYPELCTRVVTF